MFLTSGGNYTYIHLHVYVRITLPLGEAELASGSDVNGSTESFEMVIEETSMDSAVKQSLEGKAWQKACTKHFQSNEIACF